MKTVLFWTSGILGGAIAGLAATVILVAFPLRPTMQKGPWSANARVGSAAADPYLRAAVAVIGLFALHSKESIYYQAATDESGRGLRAGCEYSIAGGPLPAQWWSLTVYGSDNFLIPNRARRYSLSNRTITYRPNGDFKAVMGPRSRASNWLPTGDEEQAVLLVLRMYRPESKYVRDLSAVSLPQIRRITCSEGGASAEQSQVAGR